MRRAAQTDAPGHGFDARGARLRQKSAMVRRWARFLSRRQVRGFFSYVSNLAPGDDDGLIDVYVHDRVTKKTKRVSVDETGSHGADLSCNDGYFECPSPVLSAKGDVVAFASNAGDLVPGSVPERMDVYRVEWRRLPA